MSEVLPESADVGYQVYGMYFVSIHKALPNHLWTPGPRGFVPARVVDTQRSGGVMFGNIGIPEVLVIVLALIPVILVFLFGYFVGLSKGRKEALLKPGSER